MYIKTKSSARPPTMASTGKFPVVGTGVSGTGVDGESTVGIWAMAALEVSVTVGVVDGSIKVAVGTFWVGSVAAGVGGPDSTGMRLTSPKTVTSDAKIHPSWFT